MSEFKKNIDVKIGSDKGFGIVFALVFLIVGLYPLIYGEHLRLWAIICSLILLALSFFAQNTLTPLNKLWFKLGIWLATIISPIVMAMIYFIAVVPTGLILRLAGKDLLRETMDKDVKSYWIERDSPVGSMKNQF